MGLFEHFPYTNLHNLNLDWIIGKVKSLSDKVDSFEHASIPAGGTIGQALVKQSNADYDAVWRSVIGERGPQGPVGERGPAGPQGVQGPVGPQGERGADGRTFKVFGIYATLQELQEAHPTGQAGDAYAVGTEEDNTIYIWDTDESEWADIGSLQGPQGNPGPQGPQGPTGATGAGVPTGGTTGQALVKTSSADYNTEWADISALPTPFITASNIPTIMRSEGFDWQNKIMGFKRQSLTETTNNNPANSYKITTDTMRLSLISAWFTDNYIDTELEYRAIWYKSTGVNCSLQVTVPSGVSIYEINKPDSFDNMNIVEIDAIILSATEVAIVYAEWEVA